ncbi:class I SAM-dependent methyltransferase [Actinomadura sp. 6N118]|uniref:class I SAM-dependent methyltransferase n=1 Tax=Actinomadura sp. 6N118 TaxID=3375151 RepID=UPI0037BCF6D1
MHVLDRTADAERYDVVSGGYDLDLFAAAGIGVDEHVLDIGCGYGSTTRAAARRASRGAAVGNDVTEPMLEKARALAAAEGLGNVSFEAGDAQTHPFPESAFDVAISRFGVMFFADPVAAFANIRRALRPGGRLAFVTVGPPEGNDLPKVVGAAMPRRTGQAGAAAVHSLADPARIEAVLTGAGFQASVSSVETTIELGADAEAAAAFVLEWGAFRDAIEDEDEARAALTEAARPFEGPGGVRLRGAAWLVRAVRS